MEREKGRWTAGEMRSWAGAAGMYGPVSGAVVAREEPWGEVLRLHESGDRAVPCLSATSEAQRARGQDWYCMKPAGAGTGHPGAGRCARHGGNSRAGNREGWGIMAHLYARHLQVTPWEALLTEVQRTAGGVEWLDAKINEAECDEDLISGEIGEFVKLRERERAHLLRASKAALDAGVAQIMVDQARIEGEKIARVLAAGLDSLDISEEQRAIVTQAMHREMKAISAQDSTARQIRGGA